MENSRGVMFRVNAALASDMLRPKAKALLLLRLCQICSVMSPEKARDYWEQLKTVQHHLPEELMPVLDDLREVFEVPAAPSGGFAGERLAEIEATLKKPGATVDEIKGCLKACEEAVRKRRWPFGKEAVWLALVKAWADLDRPYALELSNKIRPEVRHNLVRRMNQQKPLQQDEWNVLLKATSQQDVVNLVLKILEDPQPHLELPGNLIPPVMAAIRGRIDSTTDIEKLGEVLEQIQKFVGLAASKDRLPKIFEALRETAQFFAATDSLSRQWAERFNAVARITAIGVSSGAVTTLNSSEYVTRIRKPLCDFAKAHCAALLTTTETAEKALNNLIQDTQEKGNAEAWYLVVLVARGMGEIAFALARESERSGELLPRIRHAWLCNDPEAAARAISASEVTSDPVGEILLRPPGPDRVAYLREITSQGRKNLSGAVWVAEKPLEEKKGFWASLLSSGKSIDEITHEYLKRNPLYSSYRVDTPKDRWFSEYLRFSGFGEYQHQLVDRVLLDSFVLWADEQPTELASLLHTMWESIRPDEDILKLDFLRNAIFTRCTTVFAAVPDLLASDFLAWLKSTLVDKSLQWQIGNTMFTLRYPETALASMCIRSALAVSGVSATRRDRLIEIGLTRYPADANTAELAAQLYNSDKEPFNLTLPWKTKSDVVEGWQVGIVKNAIQPIIQALVREATEAQRYS